MGLLVQQLFNNSNIEFAIYMFDPNFICSEFRELFYVLCLSTFYLRIPLVRLSPVFGSLCCKLRRCCRENFFSLLMYKKFARNDWNFLIYLLIMTKIPQIYKIDVILCLAVVSLPKKNLITKRIHKSKAANQNILARNVKIHIYLSTTKINRFQYRYFSC